MINENMASCRSIEYIPFDDAMDCVKNEVDKMLTKAPSIIRNYTEHLKESRGKFIRAFSVLTCAENENGLVYYDAIKFAAAIEVLHLATLVHDDVIDDAPIRRGVVTLQKKYGKRTAVICGDYLLAMSLKLAAEASDKEDYLDIDIPDYVGKVCLGELNQHINNHNVNLSIYDYLKIIAGKTAALFEASFFAGAVVYDKNSLNLKKYKLLGYYIGMIFQLTDDCIDFETPEEIAKKPVQSDFEQGVVTLPLIHALSQIESLKVKAKDRKMTRDDINEAVSKTGGLIFTRSVSKKYYLKSMKLIREIEMTESKRKRITAILDKASRGLQK